MVDWIIPWWGWFIFGFVLLLLELSSPGGFYFLFFGAGAISVGVLAWLNVIEQSWVQLTFFSIFSIVSSLLFRRRLLERFRSKPSTEIIDSIVGESATVVDDIQAGGFGKVELRGTSWNAKNSGGRMLARGDRCRVERVEGLSLWVHKEES
jgi:membrane protein implicated in regulation of membrane protease activity